LSLSSSTNGNGQSPLRPAEKAVVAGMHGIVDEMAATIEGEEEECADALGSILRFAQSCDLSSSLLLDTVAEGDSPQSGMSGTSMDRTPPGHKDKSKREGGGSGGKRMIQSPLSPGGMEGVEGHSKEASTAESGEQLAEKSAELLAMLAVMAGAPGHAEKGEGAPGVRMTEDMKGGKEEVATPKMGRQGSFKSPRRGSMHKGRPTVSLIGRDTEIRKLRDTVEAYAATRTGATVLITGKAGYGKSALLDTVNRLCGDQYLSVTRVLVQCDESMPYQGLPAFVVGVLGRHYAGSEFMRDVLSALGVGEGEDGEQRTPSSEPCSEKTSGGGDSVSTSTSSSPSFRSLSPLSEGGGASTETRGGEMGERGENDAGGLAQHGHDPAVVQGTVRALLGELQPIAVPVVRRRERTGSTASPSSVDSMGSGRSGGGGGGGASRRKRSVFHMRRTSSWNTSGSGGTGPLAKAAVAGAACGAGTAGGAGTAAGGVKLGAAMGDALRGEGEGEERGANGNGVGVAVAGGAVVNAGNNSQRVSRDVMVSVLGAMKTVVQRQVRHDVRTRVSACGSFGSLLF
jgi:hypothetical protein